MLEVFISIFVSSILKFLSHPNFIYLNGFGFFAWIYYVPFLYFIPLFSYKKSLLCGFFYGFLSYFLSCFWLIKYNIYAGLSVYVLFGIYWAVIFCIIKFFTRFYRFSFLINTLILFIFEFFITQGYLGFSYGVSGYTQWKVPFLLKAARYTKVWGITFLIILFNCVVSECISPMLRKKKWNIIQQSGLIFTIMLLIFRLFLVIV